MYIYEDKKDSKWQYKEVQDEEMLIKKISKELEICRVFFLNGPVKPSDMEIKHPVRNNKHVIMSLEKNGWIKLHKVKMKDGSLLLHMRKEINY